MAKIYISSTYSDLQTCREAVYALLAKMQRHQIVAMEDYVAAAQRPLAKCLADVSACDVYVGIFARRYGYIPVQDNTQRQSITEREFREAVKHGKPCLVFLLHEDAPWPCAHIETGDGAERLATFRQELTTKYTVSFFRTAEELAGLVSVAVSNWENVQPPQGIDPKAWQQMLVRLGQKDFELQQRDEEIKEWVQKYRDLEQRLAAEGQDSPLAQQAQNFLHAGQLDQAGRLLDQILESGEAEVERIASHHFSRARVFDLQFQLRAALPHYEKAYQYRSDNLAYAHAYADTLQNQKHYRAATPIYLASLETLRSLAKANPAAFLPNVAGTLNNLGVLYSATQQLTQAAAVYQEALTIRRQLAEANPTAFLPDVATALNNLGNLYSDTQQLTQAAAVYQEALTIRRQLAEANPAAFLPHVARTLNNLGLLYKNTQRLTQAAAVLQEALTLYRQLAEANPAAFLPHVAATLNNLGLLYWNTQQLQQAAAVLQEALTIRRQLAEANPAAFLPHVATTLDSLGLLYSDTRRPDEALRLHKEAESIRKQLADDML